MKTKTVAHTPTLSELQRKLLALSMKSWDEEMVEFVVRAINAYEENQKTIEMLLEAAKVGRKYMTPDEKTVYGVDIRTVDKAIAHAEGGKS